jgi:hypothetical protein
MKFRNEFMLRVVMIRRFKKGLAMNVPKINIGFNIDRILRVQFVVINIIITVIVVFFWLCNLSLFVEVSK